MSAPVWPLVRLASGKRRHNTRPQPSGGCARGTVPSRIQPALGTRRRSMRLCRLRSVRARRRKIGRAPPRPSDHLPPIPLPRHSPCGSAVARAASLLAAPQRPCRDTTLRHCPCFGAPRRRRDSAGGNRPPQGRAVRSRRCGGSVHTRGAAVVRPVDHGGRTTAALRGPDSEGVGGGLGGVGLPLCRACSILARGL